MTDKLPKKNDDKMVEAIENFMDALLDRREKVQKTAQERFESKYGVSLDILVDDKIRLRLNSALIESRNISVDDVKRIKDLHVSRIINRDEMAKLDPVNDRDALRQLTALNEELEYFLQDAWGFPRDNSFHYWYELPHCTCPKLDNMDMKGSGQRIISVTCPLHGM